MHRRTPEPINYRYSSPDIIGAPIYTLFHASIRANRLNLKQTAAVLCGASHASAATSVDIQKKKKKRKEKKKRYEKLVTHVELHASAVSLLKRDELMLNVLRCHETY